jgi:hypothetical protein
MGTAAFQAMKRATERPKLMTPEEFGAGGRDVNFDMPSGTQLRGFCLGLKYQFLRWFMAVVLGCTTAGAQFPLPMPTRPNSFPLALPIRPNVEGEVLAYSVIPHFAYAIPSPPPGSRFVRLFGSENRKDTNSITFGLRKDGTISAWGSPGNPAVSNVPPDITNAVQVTFATPYHGTVGPYGAALLDNGRVRVWGAALTNPALSAVTNATNVVQLSSSSGVPYLFTLHRDGTVKQWGTHLGPPFPVPSNLTNVVQISTGFRHQLALKNDGSVTAWGWGWSTYDSLAAAGLTEESYRSWINDILRQYTNVPAGVSNVVQVLAYSTDRSHTLKSDGLVVSWGAPHGSLSNVSNAAQITRDLVRRTDGTLEAIEDYALYAAFAGISGISGAVDLVQSTSGSLSPFYVLVAYTPRLKVFGFAGSEIGSESVETLITPIGTSIAKDIWIRNAGDALLKNLKVSITPSSPEISVSALPSSEIAPGEGIPLRITYTPSSSVGLNATLQISSNVPDSPKIVNLATDPRASQTIDFAQPLSDVYQPNALLPLNASSSSRLPVLFATSNTNVIQIVDNQAYIKGAGTALIEAYQPGDANFAAASPVRRTAYIGKAPASISFQPPTNAVFTGRPVFPSVFTTPAKVVTRVTYQDSNGVMSNPPVAAGSYRVYAFVDDPNYEGEMASFDLTIAKAPAGLVVGPPPSSVYTGGSIEPSIRTTPTGVQTSILYRDFLGNPMSAPPVEVGNYSAVVWIDDPNFRGAAVSSANFAITKKPATVQFLNQFGQATNSLSFVYDGSAKAVSGVGVGAEPLLPVRLTYNSIDAPPVNVGTYTITGTITDPNHTGSATGTLVIAKASQSIDFPPPEQRAFEPGATFALSATASSGLSVAISSANTNIVAITNNMATLRAAGSVVLTAKQSGNGNYNAAPAVSRTLVIGKADQQITFPELPAQTFAPGRLIDLSASSTSKLPVTFTSLNTNVLTIAGSKATIRTTGEVQIRASHTGNANYNAATPVTNTVTIGKSEQTIAPFAVISPKTYGVAPFAVAVPAAISKLPVTVTVKSGPAQFVSGRLRITGTGTVVLAANQAGNANYNAAPEVTTTFEVGKARQTITFPVIAAKTFGAADFAHSAKSSSGLPISLSVVSGPAEMTVDGKISIKGAGAVLVAANQAGSDNYQPASEVRRSFNVAKAPQTILFPRIGTRPLDASPLALVSPVASSKLPVSVRVKSGPATIAEDGKVVLNATGTVVLAATQAGNADFLPAREVTAAFAVRALSQKLTDFGNIPESKTFGDAPFSVVLPTASSKLPVVVSVKSGPAKISADRITITGAGTVVLAANQAGNASYAPAPEVIAEFPVIKNDQTINFVPLVAEQIFAPGKTLALTANATSKLPVSFATSDPSVIRISGARATIVRGGEATITATQGGSANFNAAEPVTQTLKVGAIAQTITFKAPTPQSYAPNKVVPLVAASTSKLPVVFELAEGANPDVIAIAGSTATIKGAGTVDILAKQPGSASYLAATPVRRTLVVNKAPATVTIRRPSVPYTGEVVSAPVVTTNPPGLKYNVVWKDAKGAKIPGPPTDTGAYSVEATIDEPNHAGSAKVAFNVNKAAASVTLANLAQVFNGTPRSVTVTTTPADLPVKLTYGASGLAPTNAGTYRVTAEIDHPNYGGTKVANLVVAKAPQTINFAALEEQLLRLGATKTLNLGQFATATSGLPVVFTSANTALATISGQIASLRSTGSVRITAKQPGNANYLAAPSVPQTIVIRRGAVHVKHDATGSNDGSSWQNAFTDLQGALDSAKTGEEIWVARGTYKPSKNHPLDLLDPRAKTFNLKAGVGLYGGFAGTETSLAQRQISQNPTILSGDFGDNDAWPAEANPSLFYDNAYHVVFANQLAATARLDGFVVTGGLAAPDPIAPPSDNPYSIHEWGGGILSLGSNLTVANCRIERNIALRGGGLHVFSGEVYVPDGGKPGQYKLVSSRVNRAVQVRDSWFEENIVPPYELTQEYYLEGGAAFVGDNSTVSFRNVAFSNNAAPNGGAVKVRKNYSSPAAAAPLARFYRCTFTSNEAFCSPASTEYPSWLNDGYGGAIHAEFGGKCDIAASAFIGNIAGPIEAPYDGPSGGQGGAIYVGSESRLRVATSIFHENEARAIGGAIVVSSFFSNMGQAAAELYFSTFYGNSAADGQGVISYEARLSGKGNIFYGNRRPNGNWGYNYDLSHISFSDSFTTAASNVGSSLFTAEWMVLANNGGNSAYVLTQYDEFPDYATLPDIFTARFVPLGPDGSYGTSDDGLRPLPAAPKISVPGPLPVDFADADGDGNFTEVLPFDAVGSPFGVAPFNAGPYQ